MTESKSMSEGRARILVVDDHPLFRDALVALVNGQADLVCCGQADSPAAVRAAVAKETPDIVSLDLRMGQEDGLELIKWLKAQFPGLRLVVISQCDETLYAERALRAGAAGYVMKDESAQSILASFRAVLAGETYVSHKMSVLVLNRFLHKAEASSEGVSVSKLTDRELQVFQMIGAGLGTREIAEKLNLSFKTIESHRENIKHKLGFHGANDLVAEASCWFRDQSLHSSGVPSSGQAPAARPAVISPTPPLGVGSCWSPPP